MKRETESRDSVFLFAKVFSTTTLIIIFQAIVILRLSKD